MPTCVAAFLAGYGHGLRRLRGRLALLAHRPGSALRALLVDALSLVAHPVRNGARVFVGLLRWWQQVPSRRLSGLGEAAAMLLVAPLIVPFAAELRGWIRRVEADSWQGWRARLRELGSGAPPGRSAIGSAVNAAVWATGRGTIDREVAISRGTLEALWTNPTDGRDLAMQKVCALIREHARREVCLQTYIFEPESEVGRELLAVLLEKQRAIPDFSIWLIVDGPGVERVLAAWGLRARIAIARPRWSRRGHHSKTLVIDGEIGVLGGDNVDNPPEKDLMAVVRGPVVRALLDDFADAWIRAARYPHGAGGPPTRPAPVAACPESVPMTVLSKRGLLGYLSAGYYENDADQGILAALDAAQHSISLATPELNADAVLQALRHAAERGVHVRLLLPFVQHTEWAAALDAANNHAFLAYWQQLPPSLRARIELRNFSTNGRQPEENHTKFIGVDGVWAYVGSQNLDNQSFSYSRELGIGIDDPECARRIAQVAFEQDWQTSLPVSPGWVERLVPYALFHH